MNYSEIIAILITPGLVVAVGAALWRLAHVEIQTLREEMQWSLMASTERIDRSSGGTTMDPTEWITPGIIVAVVLFIWRDLKHAIRSLADQMNRHLEGHP